MKGFIRVIALFLLLGMLCTMIMSCKDNPENPPETTNTSSVTTEPEETKGETTSPVTTEPTTTTPHTEPETTEPETTEPETTEPETTTDPHANPGVPQLKFNGETYTMMGASNYSTMNYYVRDLVYVEEEGITSINEAVKDRNNYVMDTYEVTIKGLFKDSVREEVSMAEKGGLVAANLVSMPVHEFASLIDSGSVKDLNSEMGSYLDLTQSYWNQNCREYMSIANRLYFISGDILTSDKEAIWCVSFNRDLITNNNLTNPYVLVDSNLWTYETMYEMAKVVSDYSNHDPKDYFGITWGVVSEPSNNYYLWEGTGYRMIDKDPITDIPKLTELSENAFDAMLALSVMQYDSSVTLMATTIQGVSDRYFEGTLKIFMEGHSLFNIGAVSICEWMRDKETDFGLLPMPKLDQTNDGYYSAVSASCSYAVGVQTNIGKTSSNTYDQNVIDFNAIILQALACESTDTLLEAYYSKTLVYKGLRREEDERTLKMIFDNRIYDLAQVFNWADGLVSEIGSAKSATRVNKLKSNYDKYAANTAKAIATFLTKHSLV